MGYFLLLAIAFVLVSVALQYRKTDPEKSAPARVWDSVRAQWAAIGVLAAGWFAQ